MLLESSLLILPGPAPPSLLTTTNQKINLPFLTQENFTGKLVEHVEKYKWLTRKKILKRKTGGRKIYQQLSLIFMLLLDSQMVKYSQEKAFKWKQSGSCIHPN